MTKKGLLLTGLLLLAPALTLAGQERKTNFALGLEFNANIESYERYDNTTEQTQWAYVHDYYFAPSLHLSWDGPWEVVPFISARYEGESDPYEIQNTSPQVYTELNRLSLGLGCGFFYRFAESSHFAFSTGLRSEFLFILPSWGDSAPTGYRVVDDPGTGLFAAQVDVPLILEIFPRKKVQFRVSVKTLRLGMLFYEEYFRDGEIDQALSFYSSSPLWEDDTQNHSYIQDLSLAQALTFSVIIPLGHHPDRQGDSSE